MIVSRQHYIMLHPFSRHSSGAVDVLTLSMLWSNLCFLSSRCLDTVDVLAQFCPSHLMF